MRVTIEISDEDAAWCAWKVSRNPGWGYWSGRVFLSDRIARRVHDALLAAWKGEPDA